MKYSSHGVLGKNQRQQRIRMPEERITLVSGPDAGKEFPVDGALTIGRSPDNKVFLDDRQVSREHAVVERTPVGAVIRDLGSGNGTFVDNRRVLELRLNDGDRFKIGPFEFAYHGPVGGNSRREAEQTLLRDDDEFGRTIQASSASNVYETIFTRTPDEGEAANIASIQRRLRAIYDANQIISSERDLDRLFQRVVEQIFALVPAHNAVILLNASTGGVGEQLTIQGQRETHTLVKQYVHNASPGETVEISTTIVKRALENGEAIITSDAAEDERFGAGMSIFNQNISSAMCTPLIHQNETLGVVYVDTRGTQNAFNQRDLELLVALAGPAAIAIKNAQYVRRLEQAYEDTLIVLANTIEARDHYTVGHTWRVTNFSVAIAEELAWDDGRIEICRKGGVLHDIGKIAVPDAILNKPGPLTDEEFATMKIHPEKGARILQDVELLGPMIPHALYHHEHYDGTGYPFGLSGESIPIEGRVVAVADTFDAITSNRPYRKGRAPEEAIAILKSNRGTQFDPDCVDAFVRAYENGKVTKVMQEFYKDKGKSVVCPFCSTYIPMPEDASTGHVSQCVVCHRAMKLMEKNDAFFAVLLPEKGLRIGES